MLILTQCLWLLADPLSVSSEHEDVTDDGAVTISMINFVDLAGSERSKEIALHDHEEKARMREVCLPQSAAKYC